MQLAHQSTKHIYIFPTSATLIKTNCLASVAPARVAFYCILLTNLLYELDLPYANAFSIAPTFTRIHSTTLYWCVYIFCKRIAAKFLLCAREIQATASREHVGNVSGNVVLSENASRVFWRLLFAVAAQATIRCAVVGRRSNDMLARLRALWIVCGGCLGTSGKKFMMHAMC